MFSSGQQKRWSVSKCAARFSKGGGGGFGGKWAALFWKGGGGELWDIKCVF